MNIDPQAPILILTAILVLVTAWYAFDTHRVAKASGRAADAAEAAAEAASRAVRTAELGVRLQALPILLPTIQRPDPGVAGKVTFKNRGPTVASNVTAFVGVPGNADTWRMSVPYPIEPHEAEPRATLVPMDLPVLPIALEADAVVGAEYQDPVGNRYRLEHTFQGPTTGTTRVLRWEADRWVGFLGE
jgi:hypothetical protein